ncbi:MAG: phospholipid carrier-dependent glycosyltransferase [Patescibacteria group bacterium]|nr:phospholipid carrier-dependent glycosyltransferase [Patescibacteria group bacterium]
MAKQSRSSVIALAIIIAAGLGLHLIRISYPARPVFDEAHFATYAADYVKDHVFFDIHPPLGKLIYASAIPLALRFENNAPLGDTTFVGYTKSPTGTVYFATDIPYGAFPYVPLRLISVFFGLALTVAFYFFLRNIGIGEVGALLGAFFVTFENAMLLETKLILLNGMYLAFGFAALAIWFEHIHFSKSLPSHSPSSILHAPILAGFLFALSLGVKLEGIIFIGPVLISLFEGRLRGEDGLRALKKFLFTALLVFVAISFLNFLFFSPAQILAFSKSLGIKFPAPTNIRATYFLAYAMTTVVPWTGYLVGGAQLQGSLWYGWPFMRGVMTYYFAPGNAGNLVLQGNPVVWYSSTLAVFIFIVTLLWRIGHWFIGHSFDIRHLSLDLAKAPLILFVGYLSALAPFFTFVHRGAFLYHYFPAYLFAIGLLAYLVSHWLKLDDFHSLSKKQGLYLTGIITFVVAGFIMTAPLIYGL